MNVNKDAEGTGVIELVVALVIIAVLITVGLFIVRYRNNNPSSTTSISHGEVHLHGRITEDSCFTNGTAGTNGGHGPPLGDVGCDITVNGYSIGVMLGNVLPPKDIGTVTGLNTTVNQVGSIANVYAKQIDNHTASIWYASKYYVKIY